jgi:hypothetical protein
MSAFLQAPLAQAVGALHARQPFASATQVCCAPFTHCVAPAVGHVLLHVPQLVGVPQKPPGQAVPALHVRQPFACVLQVCSAPETHCTAPAVGHACVPPHA